MTWEVVSQIATALGALFAGGSLVAGFLLYRLSERDDRAAQVRTTIAAGRAASDKLDSMVTYELVSELTSCAVNSQDLDLPFEDLFELFFKEEAVEPQPIAQYFAARFPPIMVPIHTPIVEVYEQTLNQFETDIAQYQTDYPGLFRVLRSMTQLFFNVLHGLKSLVHNDDNWRSILAEQVYSAKDQVNDVRRLKHLTRLHLASVQLAFATEIQKDIADLRALLTLVGEAYLAHTDPELVALSRAEKKEALVPVTDTKTISETLRQAEKCVRHALTTDQLLSYRETVARFEARRENSG